MASHKVHFLDLGCSRSKKLVLSYIKWQDLGHLYKRRLATEVFKVRQGLNPRLLPFFNFTESKHRGV